jgi:predicted kinase
LLAGSVPMSYYLLIRGPLGSGKSTVSRRLARTLGAQCISIDSVLDERHLWRTGRVSEFLKANEIATRRAKEFLAAGTPVIFDGNFYWKTQIADLTARLDFPHRIFTLKAPLAVCIKRDALRKPPHGRRGAEEVYAKTTRFHAGISIDATRPVGRVARDIAMRLPKRGVGAPEEVASGARVAGRQRR